MKHNGSLLLLLGALAAAGLLLCRPSPSQDAITISPSVSLPTGDAELSALEDMVQAQMLLSQRPGLQEPYSGYYKTYVDYFGGTAFVDSKLTVYVTDTSPAAVQELAKYPGVNIKKVDYSLNQLNQLALQIVELGDAGKINGYGGPPAVLPRHNRVDLTIWTDRDQAQGGLSPSALLEALGVSSAMLNIVEVADYPQDATGAYILPHPGVPPKTGG